MLSKCLMRRTCARLVALPARGPLIVCPGLWQGCGGGSGSEDAVVALSTVSESPSGVPTRLRMSGYQGPHQNANRRRRGQLRQWRHLDYHEPRLHGGAQLKGPVVASRRRRPHGRGPTPGPPRTGCCPSIPPEVVDPRLGSDPGYPMPSKLGSIRPHSGVWPRFFLRPAWRRYAFVSHSRTPVRLSSSHGHPPLSSYSGL